MSQVNAASASSRASAEDATEHAAARQDGAQNTSVSIRVESPGSSGAATQQNQTTADVSAAPGDGAGAGSVAVAVSSDSRNTTLAVAVGGPELEHPGAAGLQVWIWTWAWQHDESDSLDGLAGAAMTSWSWDWDGGDTAVPGGTITTRAADEGNDETAGSWKWSWDWSRAGVVGWAWGWNVQASLPCSSCIWIWNWTWSWTGAPGDGGSTVPPAAPAVNDASSASQLNAAQAQATAVATAGVAQVVSQDAVAGGTQTAGQMTQIVQDAGAVADARQADVGALAWSVDDLDQSNLVVSAAAVALSGTIAQSIDQVVDAADRASATQWGGQEVDIAQAGRADAVSSQRDAVLTGPGAHAAATRRVGCRSRSRRPAARPGRRPGWRSPVAVVGPARAGRPGSRRRRGGRPDGHGALAPRRRIGRSLRHRSRRRVDRAARGPIGHPGHRYGLPVDSPGGVRGTRRLGARCDDTKRRRGRAARCVERGRGAERCGDRPGGGSELIRCRCSRRPGHLADVDRGSAGRRVLRLVGWDRRLGRCRQLRRHVPGGDPVHRIRDDPAGRLPERLLLTRGASPGSSPVVSAFAIATGDEPLAQSGPPSGTAPAAGGDEGEEQADVLRGSRRAAAAAAAAVTQPRRAVSSGDARSVRTPARREPAHLRINQISALHSTQARLDTRPGSRSGTGDADREPPLPPAGDPPQWVSALAAAAASGGGPSGIAAILAGFVLVPPLLLRAREGSAVRRPIDVLSRVAVPV